MTKRYLLVSGFEMKDITRTIVSLIIFYCMYKGYTWAKNLYCVLLSLAFVMSVVVVARYSGVIGNYLHEKEVILLFAYMLVQTVCLCTLLFTKSVKAFYFYNKTGRLVVEDVAA